MWCVDNPEFLVRVPYMEIYNEDINDHLTLEGQKLPIRESMEVNARNPLGFFSAFLTGFF